MARTAHSSAPHARLHLDAVCASVYWLGMSQDGNKDSVLSRVGTLGFMILAGGIILAPWLIPLWAAWFTFQEMGIAPFAWGASLIIPFIIAVVVWSKNEKVASWILGFACVYLVGFGLAFFYKMRAEEAEHKKTFIIEHIDEYLYDNRRPDAEEIYDAYRRAESDYRDRHAPD